MLPHNPDSLSETRAGCGFSIPLKIFLTNIHVGIDTLLSTYVPVCLETITHLSSDHLRHVPSLTLRHVTPPHPSTAHIFWRTTSRHPIPLLRMSFWEPLLNPLTLMPLPHLHTHTSARPHFTKPTHTQTHTHITKQYKTTTVPIKTNTIQDIPKWNTL